MLYIFSLPPGNSPFAVKYIIIIIKFKFHWNLTSITVTLHEDRYTFVITSRCFLIRMRNVSDKYYQNTHFVFSNCFSKILPCIRQCGLLLYSEPATDDSMAHYMLDA